MVKMSVVYKGGFHCNLTHESSGSMIETDAPKDNMGKGECFSPTDLVGAALASCILTTLAIVAERDGKKIAGARAEIQKEMTTVPTRRIGSLPVQITLPKSLPDDYRSKMEHVAHNCPVNKSIHPDIKVEMTFHYI